jgi:hypothetical protein
MYDPKHLAKIILDARRDALPNRKNLGPQPTPVQENFGAEKKVRKERYDKGKARKESTSPRKKTDITKLLEYVNAQPEEEIIDEIPEEKPSPAKRKNKSLSGDACHLKIQILQEKYNSEADYNIRRQLITEINFYKRKLSNK